MRAAALVASITLLAGGALAQPTPPPGPGAPPPGVEGRPMPPGEAMGDRMGPPGGRMMGHGPHHGRRGPPPPRGAEFQIERDGQEIRIRCPDAEPVRACVDAAVVLFERLAPAPPAR